MEGRPLRKLVGFVPASSLVLGVGRDFGASNGVGSYPAVCMNFPPLWAEMLVEAVLRPYAKASDCYVGMRQNGECFELRVYCIVDVPTPLHLKLEGLDLQDHSRFVLGTDADIPVEGVAMFIERRMQVEGQKFLLMVGIDGPHPRVTATLAERWKVCLERMLDGNDLERVIEQELGIPPTGLINPR